MYINVRVDILPLCNSPRVKIIAGLYAIPVSTF